MPSMKTPNVWDDDDWETQADRALQEDTVDGPTAQEPTTKAERLAKHRETQRKIWEAASVSKSTIQPFPSFLPNPRIC